MASSDANRDATESAGGLTCSEEGKRAEGASTLTARTASQESGCESVLEAVSEPTVASRTLAAARVSAWRVKALPTRRPPAAPKTASEFTKQYVLLRKTPEAFFDFLQLVPTERCAVLVAPEPEARARARAWPCVRSRV
eukprot:6213630-Pleurochrysis_carterae.AAC.1